MQGEIERLSCSLKDSQSKHVVPESLAVLQLQHKAELARLNQLLERSESEKQSLLKEVHKLKPKEKSVQTAAIGSQTHAQLHDISKSFDDPYQTQMLEAEPHSPQTVAELFQAEVEDLNKHIDGLITTLAIGSEQE